MSLHSPDAPSDLGVLMATGNATTIIEGEGPSHEKDSPRLPRNETDETISHSTSGGNVTDSVEGDNNPHPQSPTTSIWKTTQEHDHTSMNTVIVSVLTGLIVVLCVMLMTLLLPFVRRSCRRRRASDKKRIKKRYQTVDAWLITKPVMAHSKKCHCHSTDVLTDDEKKEDDDEKEDDARECMICMEEFRVGVDVAWSPRDNICCHVYHKGCIREWLLRHMDCPYCRQVMLPIDGASRKFSMQEMRGLAEERSGRADITNYCLEHGMVVNEDEKCSRKKVSIAATSSMRGSQEDLATDREEPDDEEMGVVPCEPAIICKGTWIGDDEEIAIDEPPIPCLEQEEELAGLDTGDPTTGEGSRRTGIRMSSFDNLSLPEDGEENNSVLPA